MANLCVKSKSGLFFSTIRQSAIQNIYNFKQIAPKPPWTRSLYIEDTKLKSSSFSFYLGCLRCIDFLIL